MVFTSVTSPRSSRVKLRSDVFELVGQIDFDPLGRIRDQRMQGRQVGPSPRRVSGLLHQLARRGRQRLLSLIDLSGGKLDEHAFERIAELALQQQFPVGKTRHDHYGAGVRDVLACGLRSVGQPHGVALDVQKLPSEDVFRKDPGLDQMRVVRHVVHPIQSRAVRKSL